MFPNLFNPIPATTERWLQDLNGVRYRFDVFALDHIPYGLFGVYAFATPTGQILYIGKATNLSERLSGHERKEEARRRGATELWVHIPALTDAVPYDQTEQRLIQALCPPLNELFNWLR